MHAGANEVGHGGGPARETKSILDANIKVEPDHAKPKFDCDALFTSALFTEASIWPPPRVPPLSMLRA